MSFLRAIPPRASTFAAVLLVAGYGCGTPSTIGDASDVAADAADAADAAVDTPTGPRCGATAPACQDQSIQRLPMFPSPTGALIAPVSSTNGVFVSEVNAVGGGITPTLSFVYARFTDTGLEKVAISDEDSLASLDWDIAFRRFVIRLNSGVSGPSCVDAAQTPGGTSFDTLATVPPGLSYGTEAYFDPACAYVADSSGLGSPGSVLSTFWNYTSCVQMTGAVYVIRLRDGRQVKMQVLSYYSPAVQQQCDTTGTATSTSAAHVRIQWAFLGG
ncbi:MAG: HmuY family protein [Deltaproteobacteria bacterium]